MKSFLQEMLNSMSRNKLRSFLTAFSIAWGIMLLIILLGLGRGVQNGLSDSMKNMMGQEAVAFSVYLSKTDLPYAGLQEGRSLYLTKKQIAYLKEINPEIRHIEPRYSTNGSLESELGTSRGKLEPINEWELRNNKLRMVWGRSFNPEEIERGDRVIIIPEKAAKSLFVGRTNPVGARVTLNQSSFRVIGVMKDKNIYWPTSYIPYNTYVKYNNVVADQCEEAEIYTVAGTDNKAFEKKLRNQLTHLYRVDPNDKSAIYISSPTFRQEELGKIFKGIDILLYIIGFSTLSIGIIGVSNIMQVTVRERMKEIGIRKAIGARPRDIIALVMSESLFISITSGLIGIVIGALILRLINYLAVTYEWGQQSILGMGDAPAMKMFANPSIDMGIILAALVTLIVAGLVAGYGPARKAIKVPAVIAMRDMK